jgi:hypothetical protein
VSLPRPRTVTLIGISLPARGHSLVGWAEIMMANLSDSASGVRFSSFGVTAGRDARAGSDPIFMRVRAPPDSSESRGSRTFGGPLATGDQPWAHSNLNPGGYY